MPCGRPRGAGLVLVVGLLAMGGSDAAHAHPELDVLMSAAADAVARRPDDPEAYLYQGRVHMVAGRWAEALAAIEHAAAHGAAPDAVDAARGQVFLHAGRPDAAKREFDRVLSRRADLYGVLFDRGRASLALGDPETAARDLGRALAGMARPTPDHVFARRDALLAVGKRDEAVRALDEGIARVGPVPSLELAALDLETELGRHQDALRRIDRLLTHNPRNESWLVRRGEILERAGRPQDARTAFAAALELIEARPRHRRGKRMDALERVVRARLGPSPAPR